MRDEQAWSEEIACEGGPVLVANLADFLQWHGSEPFAPSMATELHYWSSFTNELPEAWQPNGPAGHQYLTSADPIGHREEMMDWIAARWPGTLVERGDGMWRAVRPDGKQLRAVLSPDSEYDRAIRNLGHEGIHRFGRDASAYLWSVAPGRVGIHVAPSRDTILLFQFEYVDDEAAEQQARQFVLDASVPVDEGLRYRVDPGPLVVSWAPNSARDLAQAVGETDTSPGQPGVLLDFLTVGSGALLWLEAGTYAVSSGYHQEARWGLTWCRFKRS